MQKEILVLDDGFVRLVDFMGSDSAVGQAARVSYGAGTKTVSEDRDLIRYLMRHRHTTPFEMCEFKFHIRIPMDAWRQMIRHRTASVNEVSTRYSVAIDSMAKTRPNAWRLQATTNRQGSEGLLPTRDGRLLSAMEEEFHCHARFLYELRLKQGVAREQARKDLPLSTYTEAIWKSDLHNLLHFLELRLAPAAQQEIRQYAQAIAELIKPIVPLTWMAFEDYRLNAFTMTGPDIKLVNQILGGATFEDASKAAGWPDREREECRVKLQRLGFQV